MSEPISPTPEQVIARIERVAAGDWRRLYNANGRLLNPHEMPDDVACLVKEIETLEERNVKGQLVGVVRRVKLLDTQRANEVLAKHLGLLEKRGGGHVNLAELVERMESTRRRLAEQQQKQRLLLRGGT